MDGSGKINQLLNVIESQARFPRGGDLDDLKSKLKVLRMKINHRLYLLAEFEENICGTNAGNRYA